MFFSFLINRQTPLGWLLRYGLTVAAVFAAYGVRLPLEAWVGEGLPTYITFYPIVMVAALLGGLGPGLAATTAAGLIAAFSIEPRVGGAILALPVDRLGLAIFSGMGLGMSLVAKFYRRNQEKAAAYDREQELREINREKAFLADLLENGDQPFAVGYPDGRLGLVNRAFERLTGYSAAELRTIDWSVVLTPPEWRELESEKLAELHGIGQPVRYEKEYLRKDGARVPIELQVSLKRDEVGQPEYYYAFLSDISARKRTEKELRRKEADLGEAQRLAHIGSWFWDAKTDVTTGSEELLRIYGFDPVSQSIPDFADQRGRCYPVEDWEQVNAAVQRAVQTGVGYQLDVRALRDHKQIWITSRGEVVRNAQGAIVGMRGTVQDITLRKQVEEALRESERRERQRADDLATLLEAIPTPVFIVHDPESTHITGNRAADALLLLPRGAEISLSAPPETRPRHFIAVRDGRELRVEELPAQRAARGEKVSDFEFSLVFDDGATLHLLGYGTPLLDEQGRPRGAVVVLVDITEHKRAETALRDSDLQVRALLNSVDESIWLFGLSGEVLTVNNTAARRLGMSGDELVGKKFHDFIPPGLLAARNLKFEEVVRTESPVCFEDERAGRIFEHSAYPVRNQQGNLNGVVVFARDITERKTAERERERLTKELHQLATELDTVFKALPVLVSLHDRDGRYLRVNPALVELFGIDPTNATREEVADRLRARFPDGRPLTPESMPSSRVLRGEAVSGVEYLVNDANGREHVLLFNAVPLQLEGRVSGMVLAQLDISERKQAETEIRLLNEQLGRKVVELEAVNRELEGFTYSVSHDLRAPIRHIAGFSKLLETKIGQELNPEGRKFLTIIGNAADTLGVLVDKLLEFSRIGRTEIGLVEVDLEALSTGLVDKYKQKTVARQIEWRVDKLPVVTGDATMLRFAVENLIANAVKFTSTRELARIEIGAAEDDRNYIVHVKDNGVGFDMAFYNKLFGVFQRLHSQEVFAGTGIGLANVQRIIHRHGGEVWAESKVEEGATFYFSLPKGPSGAI